jgi:hypothetical protein
MTVNTKAMLPPTTAAILDGDRGDVDLVGVVTKEGFPGVVRGVLRVVVRGV